MQSKNPFADDLAKLMRSAVGMAQGAKEEFETVFSSTLQTNIFGLIDNNPI